MKISHLLKLLTFTFSVGVTYQTAFASSTETEEVPDVMPGMIRIADIDRTEGGCAVTLRDIHPQEVHNIGVCFQRGIGVDVDLKQAFDLYTVAAEEGLPLAQCNLGIMYKNGSSVVSKDINKATEWLRKAAIQGDEVAQRALSSIS